MAKVKIDVTASGRSVLFPNGTVVDAASSNGSVTQFTSASPGLRSAELPSEIDTSPLFEKALADVGFYEQETLHIDALPEAGLRASGPAEDTIVLRPAIPSGDSNPRVVLYQDASGGLSWQFAEGSLLTKDEKERLARRGLLRDTASPEFVIPGRTGASRDTMSAGIPRGALRGFITKLGRKVLKVFVIPIASQVLARPVQEIVGAIESRARRNLIWLLTEDNYKKAPRDPFTNWKELDGKPVLLVVHGIFSSVEGMLNELPRAVMGRWLQHYGGRVLGFNHLSVTASPEDNARFFLQEVKKALPNGKFHFDILCHSRGGIVSRTMVERAQAIFAESNCTFEKVYFVASPNRGSALGDPEHIVEMLDVFTNLLTQFPDGHVLYAIEVVLGIVKLLAYTAERHLPGIEGMGTRSYIAKVLNEAKEKSTAKYAAAASDYSPRLGVDNGFFTGRFADYIMDRIFAQDGIAVANDLVVPRDSVYAANGHPSFPILNPLLYRNDDGVWHSGFFSRSETISHIEKHLGMSTDGATVAVDRTVASSRGGLRGDQSLDRTGVVTEPATLQREPSIVFHELMGEGQSSDLHVRLAEVQNPSDIENLLNVRFGEGEGQVCLTVELSAPGFVIEGPRSAVMEIRRERDPNSEDVLFRLTAKSPGPKPVTRKIVASFWEGNDCLGAVTHFTEVVPANYKDPVTPAGSFKVDPVRLSAERRESPDLIIDVEKETEDTYEISLQSQVPGAEYRRKAFGILNLAGTDFSNFFSRNIDPSFQTFPRDAALSDEQFEQEVSKWSGEFLVNLRDLGRRFWTYLPQAFREEYLRLMGLTSPLRSICVFSDEMVLPWELVIPSGLVNGQPLKAVPLGVAHIMGRWQPALSARPQPQTLRVENMVVLNPKYGTAPLYWAEKESEELGKLITGIIKPSPVDREALDQLLDNGGVQVVHFNGHGDWDNTADLAALRLENGETIKAIGFAGRKLGLVSHPILYLNACSVGRVATTVGRPGGFAAICLDGNWSGVIAPYWSVYDPSAMRFCLELYGKLKLGYSVGEALQQIRSDNPDDFTAQSYSYFGDPWARLLFQ